MVLQALTRRESLLMAAAGGLAVALPGSARSRTDAPVPTRPLEVTGGRIRGLRADGVSSYLGIPYGGNTAPCRFQPALAPKPWTGVRDCFELGAQCIQGDVGGAGAGADLSSEFVKRVLAAFKSTMETGEGSEDCLFLNIYTPDASPRRRRPVMVWLHGGGFAIGSGGDRQYDGARLCRRGDVVVVTLNHRLNALGYLYLGALHEDFADSGNVGQLDMIRALQWVRDHIAAFGGDPRNVTIFGQSGGGAKVSAMLAMPPAHGLFHKAIVQSGAALTMVDKNAAAELAERTLSALGLAKSEVHRLQTLDAKAVIKAASAAQRPGGRGLAPVVDGRALPTHPFQPVAPEISRQVPMMIGTTKDESTLFLSADPLFGKMTAEQAEARFRQMLGNERGSSAFELYRSLRPDDPPTYWVTSMATDRGARADSIRQAERKFAQHGAPVYMFRVDYHLPILDGVMRAPHGTEVPLVFDNVDRTPNLVGNGADAHALAALMSQAWINFARGGDPSQRGLAWPAYDPKVRSTMLFDRQTRVADDPDSAIREFWSRVG